MEKVKSLSHLKSLIKKGDHDFFLSFGLLRSSKVLDYNGQWHILNEIDDSEELLSDSEFKETNIYKGIGKNLYKY